MAYGIPTLPCHLFMTEPHSNLKLTLYTRYWLSSLPRLSFRSYCASKDIQLPMKISDIPRKTRVEDSTVKLLLHESTSRDANVYKGMDIKLWWAKCHQDVTVLQRNIQVVYSAPWFQCWMTPSQVAHIKHSSTALSPFPTLPDDDWEISQR